jgi:hypothetical protein
MPDPPLHLNPKEAERALEKAIEHLGETRERGRFVSKTAEALRKIREENDLARHLREARKP